MKKFTSIAILASLCLIVSGVTPQQKYIEKWAATAQKEMVRSGVPASITLAQGILESSSGQSELAVSSNNHFGIKCHSDWTGSTVYHKAERGKECFRAYKNAEQSFSDHSDFLRFQDRYKFLFDLEPTDYKGWAQGLKKAGYASDPQYPAKLIRIIEENKLYVFDTGEAVAILPEAPKELEKALPISSGYREVFNFPISRDMFLINSVPCIYAMEGETMETICRTNNLFRKELLRFNDLTSERPLNDGDVVYLALKKNKAARGVDKYIVGPGETVTLWDVSQRFGVKLSSLKRMNVSLGDAPLEEGTTVKLR